MATGKRLTGMNPLAYTGVEPVSPPQLVIEKRVPTANDVANYNIGTIWVIKDPKSIFILINKVRYEAEWVQIYPTSAGGSTTFKANSGEATPLASVLYIQGVGNIRTQAFSNNLFVHLKDDVHLLGNLRVEGDNLFNGETECYGYLTTNAKFRCWNEAELAHSVKVPFLDPGLVQLDATKYLKNFKGTADGQIPVWDNATGLPNWATLTAGTNITITNGPGSSITIDAAGGGGTTTTITTSDGILENTHVGDNYDITLSQGNNGQLLIGKTGDVAAWANLTSSDASVTITNSANAIDLKAAGGAGAGFSASFMAHFPSAYNGPYPMAGLATTFYGLGAYGNPMTTLWDTASAFYPGDGAGNGAKYTAPRDGTYRFTMNLCANAPFGASWALPPNLCFRSVNGTGSTLWTYQPETDLSDNYSPNKASSTSVLIQMDIGDTVYFDVNLSGFSNINGFNLLGKAYGGRNLELSWIMGEFVGINDANNTMPSFSVRINNSTGGGERRRLGPNGIAYLDNPLSVDFDTTGGFYPGNGTLPAKFTAPFKGKWMLGYNFYLTGNSPGVYYETPNRIFLKPQPYIIVADPSVWSMGNYPVSESFIVNLNVGDVCMLKGYATSFLPYSSIYLHDSSTTPTNTSSSHMFGYFLG